MKKSDFYYELPEELIAQHPIEPRDMELARGYEGYEDLLTTGYFEAELKKGESIIFSASLDEMG